MVNNLASRTPDRILEAALAVFSERGFEGAKTRDIAARAGVTLGLLQYHFGGKLALWKAAVDLAFGELNRGFEALLATAGDERELLRRAIHEHTHFVARHPEFVRLMHDEGKRRGPRMRWLVDRHTKPLFEKLIPLVERAQARGILPADIAPYHFVYILVGAVGIIFHQAEECKRVSGIDPSAAAAAQAHATAVEHLFLGPETKEDSQ